MKLLKKLVSLSICFSLLLVGSHLQITKAYTNNLGMPTNSFKIYDGFTDGWYSAKLSTAMRNWNSGGYAYIGPDFTDDNLTNHAYQMYDPNDTASGYYYTNYDAPPTTNFDIIINTAEVPNNGTTASSNEALGAITHELGHPLSLSDIDSIFQSHKGDSIMSYFIDRTGIYTPQTYDYNEVYNFYN